MDTLTTIIIASIVLGAILFVILGVRYEQKCIDESFRKIEEVEIKAKETTDLVTLRFLYERINKMNISSNAIHYRNRVRSIIETRIDKIEITINYLNGWKSV